MSTMKDNLEDSKEIAEQATYEDESATSKRTVTIRKLKD
jgi:hypothetical protein